MSPRLRPVMTLAATVFALVIGPWPTAAARAADGELVIFGATSLKEAFGRLAQRFEKEHPGAKVIINAAGTQELQAQIEHGAAADVFASADHQHMNAVLAQGLVVSPSVLICNEPVVVVRASLASSVKTFGDLPRVERIVIGAPEVPIGAYTLRILDKAAVKYGPGFPARFQAKVASRELNVRQVLAKVMLGEADAGIVYRSDTIKSEGKVAVLVVPPELNVTAEYPIAILKKAPNPVLARLWLDFARSSAGLTILRDAGFVPCPTR